MIISAILASIPIAIHFWPRASAKPPVEAKALAGSRSTIWAPSAIGQVLILNNTGGEPKTILTVNGIDIPSGDHVRRPVWTIDSCDSEPFKLERNTPYVVVLPGAVRPLDDGEVEMVNTTFSGFAVETNDGEIYEISMTQDIKKAEPFMKPISDIFAKCSGDPDGSLIVDDAPSMHPEFLECVFKDLKPGDQVEWSAPVPYNGEPCERTVIPGN
jgi:hypothetical protein